MRPSVKVSVRTPPNTKNLFREAQPTKIKDSRPIPCAAHLESRQMSGSGRQKERASVSTRNCVRRGQKQLRRVFGIEPNVLGIEIGGPVHRLPRSEADL